MYHTEMASQTIPRHGHYRHTTIKSGRGVEQLTAIVELLVIVGHSQLNPVSVIRRGLGCHKELGYNCRIAWIVQHQRPIYEH